MIGAFPMASRKELFAEMRPLVTTFDGHPWNWSAQRPRRPAGPGRGPEPAKLEHSRWNAGKDLSFVPLRPERVVEVRYEHMEGTRFRHTAQFVSWRPDREPLSCGFAQLEEAVSFNLADILAGWDREEPAWGGAFPSGSGVDSRTSRPANLAGY